MELGPRISAAINSTAMALLAIGVEGMRVGKILEGCVCLGSAVTLEWFKYRNR